MKGLIMLNKIKNLVSKNETKKIAINKNGSNLIKVVQTLSNKDNRIQTIKTYKGNIEQAHENCLENFPYFIALGYIKKDIDLKASKSKNPNKTKDMEYLKIGIKIASSTDKGKTKFIFNTPIFTKQLLSTTSIIVSKNLEISFYNFLVENKLSNIEYGIQGFRKKYPEKFDIKPKAPSHKRKTEKETKQKTKQKIVKVLPNKTLALEFTNELTSKKNYKDRDFETCLKDAYYFLEIICSENGIEFEQFMKVKQNKGLETLKKVFKIAS